MGAVFVLRDLFISVRAVPDPESNAGRDSLYIARVNAIAFDNKCIYMRFSSGIVKCATPWYCVGIRCSWQVSGGDILGHAGACDTKQ